LPPLTESERVLRDALQRDVEMMAAEIGERHVFKPDQLAAAANFITGAFEDSGYRVRRQSYQAMSCPVSNMEEEITGTGQEKKIVVVGAHYDSVVGCPAANDNASGVAALLALARAFARTHNAQTLRLAAFVNEEPPFFQTSQMGSVVYAGRCKKRMENIMAMICLETIGCYSDVKGSQKYPFPLNFFYPSPGNFIGFVANIASRGLLREVVDSFRRHTCFPSEGAAAPDFIPGVGWSDHWSFWQEGYPAVMVTDTALYRYPYYHTPQDTPEKINYDRMARVTAGLERVIKDLISK